MNVLSLNVKAVFDTNLFNEILDIDVRCSVLLVLIYPGLRVTLNVAIFNLMILPLLKANTSPKKSDIRSEVTLLLLRNSIRVLRSSLISKSRVI